MTMRTSSETVTFDRPFVLSGIEGPQAPGTYTVETDEELVEGSSLPAYRRVSTMIRLPGRGGGERAQIVAVHPDELAAALARDAQAHERRSDESVASVRVGIGGVVGIPRATPAGGFVEGWR